MSTRRPTRAAGIRSTLSTAVARLRRDSSLRPRLALVLGSGFDQVASRMEVDATIPYERLPGFPAPTVKGHAGRVLLGRIEGTPVCLMSGRVHYYEGHSLEEVTFGVRLLASFGVTDLVLTNAAGGIRRSFRPGDFMLITDHINFMGVNPLRGTKAVGGRRFVDLTAAYDAGMLAMLRRAARRCGLRLRAGVYLAVSGPSYETPAEIRAFRRLGADAVGMSTVPEVIVARQCGLRVAGLSCITNLAAGHGNPSLSHADVLAAGERVGDQAAAMVAEFARMYAEKH